MASVAGLVIAALTAFGPLIALATATPDDSEAARQAAVARLKAAALPRVCDDLAVGSRAWGTSCASREFRAPGILETPRMRWKVDQGWWGVWSPWVAEGLVLTGSCNNDTNKGLSALDMQTGKVRWRLSSICDEGARAGTMGDANFQEAGPGKVFFALSRTDGKPYDIYIIDLKTGRILEQLKPQKRGPTIEVGGAFTVLTASKEAQRSYLNLLSPKLDRIVWRNEDFRASCAKLDYGCVPVFTQTAATGNALFISATSLEQREPPTRELHAFDLGTGALRWKHTDQPVREVDGQGRAHRSDDGRPMVVDGKVIIRIQTEHHYALRALDPVTGRIVWTTEGIERRVMEPRGLLGPQTLSSWIGAGSTIVGYAWRETGASLMAWSASDGRQLWVRDVPQGVVLTASAGGVFYTGLERPERKETFPKGDILIEGFEAATGTRLWSTSIDTHNLPFTGEWSVTDLGGGATQGPAWRIGSDGAIYGITLKGAYKLH